MSSEVSIAVRDVSKAYELFARPVDRLKQMVIPRIQRSLGYEAKRYFTQFWALQDISLTVNRGETVGIVGRNGSGKSTLLQIICGILRPTSGTAITHGRVCALLELGAGFNPEFSGIENVLLSGQLLGLSRKEVEDTLPLIEEFAEIGEFIRHPVKTYSSGMFVRLAFATQAFVKPDILVIDEALAVGDARFQAKCLARLDDLRSTGTSILFVSHDVSSVRRFCDRAVWIEQGRMQDSGDVDAVTAAYMEFMFSSRAKGAPPSIEGTNPELKAATNAIPAPLDTLRADQLVGAPNHLPIRRWGERTGLVRAAVILDGSTGIESGEVRVGQTLQILIYIQLPEDIVKENLSVSFSLKDSKGTDVVVASTWNDPECRFVSNDEGGIVQFSLENMLNEGEYILVAAIEDRSSVNFIYLDYVEGAAYMRSHCPELRWGVFVPPVRTKIQRTRKL